MLKELFKALRPKQWIKNLLVIAPLIFSQQLFDYRSFIATLGAFCSFCLVASAMYLVNDLYDLESDRVHPIKKHRPLASGLISTRITRVAVVVLLVTGFIIAALVRIELLWIIFLYVVMIYAYTHWLKKVVLLDVVVVASGFVLRALGGVVTLGAVFSEWLLVTTFFAALFLVVGKRRHELVLLGDRGVNHRSILGDYSLQLLDQLIIISVTCSLMSYSLYTLSSETVALYGFSNLVFTIPFVMYGLFRYLYLVYKQEKGGDPTESLLADGALLLTIGLWGISVIAIIYRHTL